MRSRFFSVGALAALLGALAIVGVRRASAEYVELDQPSVAFSAEYPKADQEQVLAVLNSDKVKFVGGSGLNSMTTLKYRGDSKALSLFLDELAKCHDLVIHISLARPSSSGDVLAEGDFLVHHEAHRNHFNIRVNLDSKNIDLEKLYLPEIHTAKAAATK